MESTAETSSAATLGLRRPVGWSFVAAILLLAGGAACTELFSRTDLARRALPLQSVGCGQPQLDAKLVLLGDMIRRDGPIDGLFFGSSMVYRGVDPAVVADEVRKRSGRSFRSFNFGLGGLSETGEEPLAKIVVDKYRPSLMIVGASPFGLDDDRGVALTARLVANPWVRHHHGEPNLDGWLVEHSDAFRTYLGLRFRLEPMSRSDRQKLRGMMEGMRANGYGFTDDATLPELDEKSVEYFGSYEASAAHVESLARILALRSEVPLVVVEVPVHDAVVHRFGRGDEAYRSGLDAIERAAASAGVPFWRYPADRPIPPEGWADFTHMNAVGAEVFSRWLGERLGQASR